MKKKHIDFIIPGRSRKRMIRFYPRESRMHSFGDEPPKDYRDVYKVYYSWAILESRLEAVKENGEEKWSMFRQVFSMPFDECSCIESGLETALKLVMDHRRKEVRELSCGWPGSVWRIVRMDGTEFDLEEFGGEKLRDNDTFFFEVFDNDSDKGYRFSLNRQQAEDFRKYIKEVNAHMLENGEPI